MQHTPPPVIRRFFRRSHEAGDAALTHRSSETTCAPVNSRSPNARCCTRRSRRSWSMSRCEFLVGAGLILGCLTGATGKFGADFYVLPYLKAAFAKLTHKDGRGTGGKGTTNKPAHA